MSPLGICEKMKVLSFKMKGAGPLIRPSEIGDGRIKIYKFVQDGALIFKFICYLCKKVSPIEQLNVERAVALHSFDANEDSIVHAADSFIELLGFRVVHHHTVTPFCLSTLTPVEMRVRSLLKYTSISTEAFLTADAVFLRSKITLIVGTLAISKKDAIKVIK